MKLNSCERINSYFDVIYFRKFNFKNINCEKSQILLLTHF